VTFAVAKLRPASREIYSGFFFPFDPSEAADRLTARTVGASLRGEYGRKPSESTVFRNDLRRAGRSKPRPAARPDRAFLAGRNPNKPARN
jgi:hypothetical protein